MVTKQETEPRPHLDVSYLHPATTDEIVVIVHLSLSAFSSRPISPLGLHPLSPPLLSSPPSTHSEPALAADHLPITDQLSPDGSTVSYFTPSLLSFFIKLRENRQDIHVKAFVLQTRLGGLPPCIPQTQASLKHKNEELCVISHTTA